MKENRLQSEEFHKDMEEAIRAINKKFHLDIKCGLVTFGEESLTIQLKTREQ